MHNVAVYSKNVCALCGCPDPDVATCQGVDICQACAVKESTQVCGMCNLPSTIIKED